MKKAETFYRAHLSCLSAGALKTTQTPICISGNVFTILEFPFLELLQFQTYVISIFSSPSVQETLRNIFISIIQRLSCAMMTEASRNPARNMSAEVVCRIGRMASARIGSMLLEW